MNGMNITAAIFTATASVALAGEPIELTFVDHITAGMVEQDVFVETSDDGNVMNILVKGACRSAVLNSLKVWQSSTIVTEKLTVDTLDRLAKLRTSTYSCYFLQVPTCRAEGSTMNSLAVSGWQNGVILRSSSRQN
jgi:hypothetical protein